MAASCLTAATIKFTVRRRPAVLVAPASPTPRELKQLSDLDDHDFVRLQIPVICFVYLRKESMSMGGKDKDPALVVIQDAVARALVPYYPFAGRQREDDGGKRLAVDCTAQGVLFVEADADVRLEQFGDDALLPPFPCVEELIFYDVVVVPGSSDILNAPVLLIQVTRLALAVRLTHPIADAPGLMQFLGAVAELARGDALAPAVPPVWERHLLEGRRMRNDPTVWAPQQRQSRHHGGNKDSMLPSSFLDDMALRSFFFGPGEIAAIRAQLSSSSPELEKRASWLR